MGFAKAAAGEPKDKPGTVTDFRQYFNLTLQDILIAKGNKQTGVAGQFSEQEWEDFTEEFRIHRESGGQ